LRCKNMSFRPLGQRSTFCDDVEFRSEFLTSFLPSQALPPAGPGAGNHSPGNSPWIRSMWSFIMAWRHG
jgi:hypothetical protein